MRLCLVIVLVFALVGVASATITQTHSVLSAGGNSGTSGTYTVQSILGQPFVGYTMSGSTQVWHGFFGPLLTTVTDVLPPTVEAEPLVHRWTPNPAQASTTLQFGIGKPTAVRIAVYNVRGQVVRDLLNHTLPAGTYRQQWDLLSTTGVPVANGVYFLRMQVGSVSRSERIIVLR